MRGLRLSDAVGCALSQDDLDVFSTEWIAARSQAPRVCLHPAADAGDPQSGDIQIAGSVAGICRWDPDSDTLHGYIAKDPHSIRSVARLACIVSAWNSGGLFFHAAGLALGERGVLALAPSGGGKSTLSDLAEGFSSLSDESCLVELGSQPTLVGTPFRSSSVRLPEARSVTLRAILLLDKGAAPGTSPIEIGRALPQIIRQAYRPPRSASSPLELLRRIKCIAERVPAYRFTFPRSPAAGRLLREFFAKEIS